MNEITGAVVYRDMVHDVFLFDMHTNKYRREPSRFRIKRERR